MKYLILTCLFLIVTGCFLDSFFWHKHNYTVPCTVTFKADPLTSSRGGYPYYYVEVRQNATNEWSRECITGEFYSKLNVGDQVNFTFQRDATMGIHIFLEFFGSIAFLFVAAVMPGRKKE